MCRARNADAPVCDNLHSCFCVPHKAVLRIYAQIHFMVSTGNVERLCEFAGS